MPEEKTVEVELLADGIRVEGVDYVQGDVVTLPKEHAERLQKHGSVGPKGSVEKAEKAAADRDEAEARHQRYLVGLGPLEAGDGARSGDSEGRDPAARGKR